MNNFFTNNLGAKIIALVLAIGVWVYVASGQSKIFNLPSSLAIAPKSVGEGLIAKLGTTNVQIKVSVERKKLKNLSADSFDAYVDLTGKTKGTYTDVPVMVTAKDSSIEIREITPMTITVTLDPAISKSVPVAVKIDGKPGEGLAPDNPIVEPETVEVRGGKSDVDRILEATAVVKLKGETSEVKKTVTLQGFDAKGDEIKDLSFSPAQITATIPIVKAGKTKTVGIKVNTTGAVKNGFWASQISVTPNVVSITGNGDALSTTKFIETEPINIDGLGQNQTFTTKLAPPTGIVLIDNIEDVKVNVVLSASDTTKEVVASINSINLTSTLQLDTSKAEPLTVLVSGPADKLASLNSSNVTVTLDLGIFRSPQVTKIDVSKDWIKVPDGVSVIQFNPSAITINLAAKNS